MAAITHASVKKGAGYNLLTIAEFFAMPLKDRVALIFSQSVEFLDDHGGVIPLADALDQLAELSKTIGTK